MIYFVSDNPPGGIPTQTLYSSSSPAVNDGVKRRLQSLTTPQNGGHKIITYLSPEGRLHGNYEEMCYSSQGLMLMVKGTHLDDLKDGLWRHLWATGKLKSEGVYFRDLRVGEWRYWYPSGIPRAETYYDGNGAPNGEWKFWHPNGRLMWRGSYDNGIQNGKVKQWDSQGNLIKNQLYHNGALVKNKLD